MFSAIKTSYRSGPDGTVIANDGWYYHIKMDHLTQVILIRVHQRYKEITNIFLIYDNKNIFYIYCKYFLW